MTFRYALKRMIRTPWASLATVGLAAALCVLLSLLTDMRARQERELETVYDTMEIRCTVTSADGVRTDGLQLSSAIDCLIYDIEGYGLTDFIFDLDQKVTFVVKLEDKIIEDPPTLTAISSPAAVPAFREEYGVNVEFLAGYSWESMRNDAPLLVVSEAVMETYGLVLGDSLRISIQNALFFPEWLALSDEPRTFQVIGCARGMQANTMYCSFHFMKTQAELEGLPIYSESASFVLKDNRRLEEFRAAAAEYFQTPDATAGSSAYNSFALVIQDQLFRETVADLTRDIRLSNALVPAVCVLCLCVGVCSGLIGVRARRQELVLMRCVGTPRRRAFTLMLLEQVLLGATGALLGMLGVSAAGQGRSGFGAACLCAACFAGGAAGVAWRFASRSVAALMREKE